MTPIAPRSGRLMLRTLSEGTAVVGVLTLPAHVRILEGAAYALRLTGTDATLYAESVGPALPLDAGGATITDWLYGQSWFRTTDAEIFTVRFVEAFPDTNTWTVCGVTHWPFPPALGHERRHAWTEVAAGRCTPLEAPINAIGMGLAQVLVQHALWPDASGALHRLSQLVSAARPTMHAYHVLLARAGAGELTPDELQTQLRAEPAFVWIGYASADRDFLRYLAQLQAQGALLADSPRSAAAHADQERIARDAVAAIW